MARLSPKRLMVLCIERAFSTSGLIIYRSTRQECPKEGQKPEVRSEPRQQTWWNEAFPSSAANSYPTYPATNGPLTWPLAMVITSFSPWSSPTRQVFVSVASCGREFPSAWSMYAVQGGCMLSGVAWLWWRLLEWVWA